MAINIKISKIQFCKINFFNKYRLYIIFKTEINSNLQKNNKIKMIHHIVMWKLKEADKKENAHKIKKDLEALKNIIKELKFIQVSFNMDIAPRNNFDVILDTHFNSFEQLNIYANHPEHLKVVEFIKTVIDQRVAIDYEVN